MTPRRRRVVLLGLLVTLLLDATGAVAQPARERPVGERAAAYRTARARAGGFLLSPLAVTERLLTRRPTVVVDVRRRSRFETFHLRGARPVPLATVLEGRDVRPVRAGTTLVVVDDDGTSAIEAMVVLRLAGVRAFAMSGGMDRLRRLLANPDAVPQRSPVARRLPEARALLVGSAAGAGGDGSAGGARWLGLLLVAVVLVALLAAALVVWRAARARRQRLALAIRQIDRDEPQSLRDAVFTLQDALEGGLRPRERTEARFALAYAMARLGAYPQASEALEGADPKDGKVLALDLWLKVRQGLDDKAVERYEDAASVPDDSARRAMLVAYLRRGRRLAAVNDVDEALESFERAGRLRRPGDPWRDDAPDPRIAVGVMALLEGRLSEARYRFEQAGESQGHEHQGRLGLEARIGELLCDWRMRNDPDQRGRYRRSFDDDLGVLVEEARAAGADRPLLCGLLLWHAASRIRGWRDLPVLDGLPRAERDLLRQRLDKVREIDPELGDAYLLGGVVALLFGEDGSERDEAFEALRQARELGVSVPEVLGLVEDAADGAPPPSGRFSPLPEDDPSRPADRPAPLTVAELESRGRLAGRRAAEVRTHLTGDGLAGLGREVDELLEQLRRALHWLRDGAAEVIRIEQQLAVRTGELQLLDEQGERG